MLVKAVRLVANLVINAEVGAAAADTRILGHLVKLLGTADNHTPGVNHVAVCWGKRQLCVYVCACVHVCVPWVSLHRGH